MKLAPLAIAFLTIFLTSRRVWAAANCIDLNPNTVAELEDIIRNPVCQISSIDDLLGALIKPEKPVLVYKSQSLQGPHQTDYMNPRAIIGPFGTDSNQLFLTFNGKEDQSGYKTLEVVAIDKTIKPPLSNVLNYYDIGFDGEGQNLNWSRVQRLITVSKPNPSKCITCHGSPARPIFPDYPKWTGMYGSFNIAEDPIESLNLNNFKKRIETQQPARYRRLNFGKDGPLSLIQGGSNERLNGILWDANSIRVARLAQQTPNYQSFKFAILGAMADCEHFSELIPSSIKSSLETNLDKVANLQSIYSARKISEALRDMWNDGPSQFGDGYYLGNNYSQQRNILADQPTSIPFSSFLAAQRRYFADSDILFKLWIDTLIKQGSQRPMVESAKIRYIFESRGIDISTWFLDLKQPTYRIMGGGYDSLWRALVDEDSDFAALHGLSISLDSNRICTELKTKSLAALNNFTVKPISAPVIAPSGYPATFTNTCAQCHDGSDAFAPPIPFSNEPAFSNWLSQNDHKLLVKARLTAPEESRMPLNRNLNPAELSQIFKYLNEH